MTKYIIVASLIVVCLLMLLVYVRYYIFKTQESSAELELLDSYESGKLYKAGNIRVLQLEGTYRQMGRQYGKLMNAEINAAYEVLVTRFLLQTKGLQEKAVKGLAAKEFEFYPERLKEIIYGMAETSTLDISASLLMPSNCVPTPARAALYSSTAGVRLVK